MFIVTDCRNIDPSKGCPKVGGSLNSVEAALYTIPGYVDKVKNGDIEFKYFGNNAYKGTVHGTTVVYVRIFEMIGLFTDSDFCTERVGTV